MPKSSLPTSPDGRSATACRTTFGFSRKRERFGDIVRLLPDHQGCDLADAVVSRDTVTNLTQELRVLRARVERGGKRVFFVAVARMPSVPMNEPRLLAKRQVLVRIGQRSTEGGCQLPCDP